MNDIQANIRFQIRARHVLLIGAILLVFSAYWCATLVYNLPQNPIKLRYSGAHSVWDMFMYQKWSFFAPPGSTDSRLDMVVIYEDGRTKKFDIGERLYAEKRRMHPFNSSERLVDYVVFGAAGDVGNTLIRSRDQSFAEFNMRDVPQEVEERFLAFANMRLNIASEALLSTTRSQIYPQLVIVLRYVRELFVLPELKGQSPPKFFKLIFSHDDIPRYYEREKISPERARGENQHVSWETPFLEMSILDRL